MAGPTVTFLANRSPSSETKLMGSLPRLTSMAAEDFESPPWNHAAGAPHRPGTWADCFDTFAACQRASQPTGRCLPADQHALVEACLFFERGPLEVAAC